MQVPEHLVSLYVATCGQNGAGLGSDEKEIILLVYVILEASSGKIVGTKQLLVRPEGSFVKDRSISTSSDASNAAGGASSPLLALTHTDAINNNNSNTSNSNVLLKGSNSISNCVNSNNNSIDTNSLVALNNNSNNSINNTNSNVITNGPSTTTICNTTNNAPSTPTTEVIELPITVAQAAGKPLQEAIEEIDEYLRSLALNIDDVDSIKIITDGQLPLRQCLHREACAKDIELPAYYQRFCDLRKEFLKYKSGDLSRALVPMKDIKKILQMPVMPAPQSIGEMMKELNISSSEETEFYIKESRDMVSVIQALLNTGHKFTANEIVSMVLEPGICSIDDEIDGNCIVRARGLPWQSSDQDIAKFFRGLNVAKGGVALCLSPLGRRNGEALIRFVSQEHRDMALKRHKHHIGSRYIEVYRATGDDFLAIAGGASNEAQAFLSKGAQVIIRMRGLPYDCTGKQVLDFFTTGDDPCNVLDGTEGVLFVKKPDGRATGDAFVLFANESDAPKALSRHRESIGQRYIELFRSTTAEVQQVLNRSMDPRTYEAIQQPPLIAQLPMSLSLLPQHLITSGTTKNCIRLRGLPYEALVEHILHFLDDFAKHIIYQGVHMVINAQGQPSGEAFIQMDSEESARLCALRKHNQFMMFGKKYRYIEVFQCSGDDMNMVLNGGLQSPVATTHHAHHHPGATKQPSLLSPGASVMGAPFGAFTHFGPPTPLLAAPHPHPHRSPHHAPGPHPHHHAHHPAATAAFYPPPLLYWSYPTPPVSPTTYYSQPPTHSSTAALTSNIAAHHQAMYSLDFLSSPLSPPGVAIPTPPSTGLILSPNKTQNMSFVPPKHYSPLPTPVVSLAAPTTGTVTAGGAIGGAVPTYQAKLALPSPTPPQQQHQTSKIYHYTPVNQVPPAALAQPTVQPRHSAASPIATAANTPTPTAAGTQPLLIADVTHSERPTTLKLTTTAAAVATGAGVGVGTVPPKVTNNVTFAHEVSTGAPTSSVGVMTNTCVELYIA